MSNHFMIDNAGTLIDKSNGWCYDYPSEILPVLNRVIDENEHYKAMFFEIVETALTDKNCRKEYCKGILNIFDECNDLNEARKQIMEFLE